MHYCTNCYMRFKFSRHGQMSLVTMPLVLTVGSRKPASAELMATIIHPTSFPGLFPPTFKGKALGTRLLFTEVEVNSGGYLSSREAAR